MKTFITIERLEPRIAPASLMFSDGDGDNDIITTTGAGTLTLGVNVMLTFGLLQKLDLTDEAFQDASVSIIARRDPESGGDGHVKGHVEQAQILAGYGTSLNSMNADAQIRSASRPSSATPATPPPTASTSTLFKSDQTQ